MSVVLIVMMTVAAVFGTYIVASLVLFKYPNLIHTKKMLKFRCKHISHRGGAGENLENTLTAFKHARDQGTDMLEIDVQLTNDGEVVVSHDNHLARACGVNYKISDLNYRELPPLQQNLPVDFSDSQICAGGSDRQIPLLRDVFQQHPTMPINIDVKTDEDLLIRKTEALIREYGRETLTVWGSASNAVVNKCYKENPNIPMFFSFKGVIKLVLLMYTGLLPFVPLRESCLEILMPSTVIKKRLSAQPNGKKFRVALWLIEKLLMRKALFNHLAKRGIQTYLWVLNTEEDFERAFRLGATGVMTDFPTRLKDFLRRNTRWA